MGEQGEQDKDRITSDVAWGERFLWSGESGILENRAEEGRRLFIHTHRTVRVSRCA
jgi:hypothetical protein